MAVIVYTSLILLYIVHQFFPLPFLSYLVGILAVAAVAVSFKKASGLYFVTGLFFLIAGFVLFVFSGQPWHTFFIHFDSMLKLLALFVVLPFINSLIRVGRFDSQLNQLLKMNTKRLSQLYVRSSFVTHILGIFLNIAVIPLLLRSLSFSLAAVKENVRNRFYSYSLLRAYALCLTWSPLEVMVSVTVDLLNVKYYQVFPITLLLAALFMGADWALYSLGKNGKQSVAASESGQQISGRLKRKIFQLAGILFLFITVVTFVDFRIGKGFLFSVVIVIVPFSLSIALIMRKFRQYLTVTLPHWKERTRNLANYFFMFLSAGFFVDLLSDTGWLVNLQSFFMGISQQPFLFYLVTGGYFLITSLLGFHVLVSLTLYAEILGAGISQVASLSFAVVLITATLSTVMFSPYNVSVSLLSGELRVNPYRVALWNMGFAVGYMFFCICFACLLAVFS